MPTLSPSNCINVEHQGVEGGKFLRGRERLTRSRLGLFRCVSTSDEEPVPGAEWHLGGKEGVAPDHAQVDYDILHRFDRARGEISSRTWLPVKDLAALGPHL